MLKLVVGLYAVFMIFFVPGPVPFGLTVEQWGIAWGVPGLLLLFSIAAWRLCHS